MDNPVPTATNPEPKYSQQWILNIISEAEGRDDFLSKVSSNKVVMKFAQEAAKTHASLKDLQEDIKTCTKGLSQFGDSFKVSVTRLSTLVNSTAVKSTLTS